MKRYWSTLPPFTLSNMRKAEIDKYKSFDANLQPDDIFEMQKIDADCNDCRHFQRGKMREGLGLACFEGRCAKFDKATLAWPMQYTGHECFEHRRAA